MRINFKIVKNGEQISLRDAIKEKYVSITDEGICNTSENIKIFKSTGLYDYNSKEIFENDILIDNKGRKYKVVNISGTFCIKGIGKNKDFEPFALNGLKLNDRVDSLEIIQ